MAHVINVRGTNGSGKSTLVRSLFGSDQRPVKLGAFNTPAHWLPELKTIVVGPYPEGKATGGMDCVRTSEEAIVAVAEAANVTQLPVRAVVFEGILISTVYARWKTLSARLRAEGHSYTWAYLVTPLEECVNRVGRRRVAAGRPPEGFNATLVEDKFRSIAGTRGKAKADGETVVDLLPGLEHLQLLRLIREGSL